MECSCGTMGTLCREDVSLGGDLDPSCKGLRLVTPLVTKEYGTIKFKFCKVIFTKIRELYPITVNSLGSGVSSGMMLWNFSERGGACVPSSDTSTGTSETPINNNNNNKQDMN